MSIQDRRIFPEVRERRASARLRAFGLFILFVLGAVVGISRSGFGADGRADQWGYIDKSGQYVVQPEFSEAQRFSEGLAAVKRDSIWGYIDRSGHDVIQPRFDEAGTFSNHLAPVEVDRRWGYIDRSGSIAIKPQYEMGRPFLEGLAAVNVPDNGHPRKTRDRDLGGVVLKEVIEIGSLWGFVSASGQMAIKPRFEEVGSFSGGLAPVRVGKKWGYIDKAGHIVIKPQFERASEFSEGLALVTSGEKDIYIDLAGKTRLVPQYTVFYPFTEGLTAAWSEGSWVFIDRSGKIAVETGIFIVGHSMKPYAEGMARFCKIMDRCGYIDRTGKTVINARFIGAGPFSEGLAGVQAAR